MIFHFGDLFSSIGRSIDGAVSERNDESGDESAVGISPTESLLTACSRATERCKFIKVLK